MIDEVTTATGLTTEEEARLDQQTGEGAQELQPRQREVAPRR